MASSYVCPRAGRPLGNLGRTGFLLSAGGNVNGSFQSLALPVFERDLFVGSKLTDAEDGSLVRSVVAAGHRAVLPGSVPPPETDRYVNP